MQFSNGFIPKRPSRPPDHGWRLTLADMMTLLLCFFVIMLSVSKVDATRYEAMADILADAMSGKPPEQTAQPGAVKVDRTAQSLFQLQVELARLVKESPWADAVELKLRPDAVAINLKGSVLFGSGKAVLSSPAITILDKVVQPLMAAQYFLTIEGHSDNVPIRSQQYPSNWELSSARASAVARYFIAQGFPKNDIQVLGLADTRPLAPNLDQAGAPIPANQSKNRRVVILVKPGRA